MMFKTSGLAIASGAIALSACSSQPAPQPMGSPTPSAGPREVAVPPPNFTDLPATGCMPPQAGTLTVGRGETVSRGSMQFYYSGRDMTYRTDPYVYMFESNAPLRNRNNTMREAHFFGLWRGQTQTAEVCGRTVRVDLVRATETSATINIHR
jgi:hypothetical protein